jgi:hypothetical protein
MFSFLGFDASLLRLDYSLLLNFLVELSFGDIGLQVSVNPPVLLI